jgi:hypothetical protein
MFSVNYHFPPVESEDGPHVVGIANFLRRMQVEMQPGARLVEYLPWLTYVPSRCVIQSKTHCIIERLNYQGLSGVRPHEG